MADDKECTVSVEKGENGANGDGGYDPMLEMAQMEYERSVGEYDEESHEYTLPGDEGLADADGNTAGAADNGSDGGDVEKPELYRSAADRYVLSVAVCLVLGILLGALFNKMIVFIVLGLIVGCVLGMVLTFAGPGKEYLKGEIKSDRKKQKDE